MPACSPVHERTLSVGVAGCGYWGSKHVRVLDSMSRVDDVVVIDPDDDARKAVQQSHPRVRGFAELAPALPTIDALVVATPPHLHSSIAMTALRAGKHVLVEKPMTTSSRDAETLIEEAAAAGLTLMVGHTFEYNAAVWRLRDCVQDGELGDVYYADTARLNLGLYQPDVNVVWDLAPHDVSILDFVFGSRPTQVEACGHSFAGNGCEDVAYLTLEYGDIGVEAHVHVSWLDPCKVRRMTVVGSEKMAVYNDVATEEKLRIYDKGVALGELDGSGQVPMSYRYGSIVAPFIDFKEPLKIEEEHFIDCLNSGRIPYSDGVSGLAVVTVLEAADQSIREHRAIHLSGHD